MMSVSLLVCLVTAASLVINARVIEPFYIYQKKLELARICDELLLPSVVLDSYIPVTEKERGVVIARIPNTDDNTLLNQRLRKAFLDKGIGLQRFWLWEEDYKSTVKNGTQMRIYSQGSLDYSLMIQNLLLGDEFISVAMVIPNIAKTVDIVNRITVFIFGGAVLLILLLLYYLVRRVTGPIDQLGRLAVDIANGRFRQAAIRTGDELEELADRLNEMSGALEQSQQALQRKNQQMQALLGHVSHDLKTPISLVKAYGSGIRDGMDDGTFLDTILHQNTVMEQMTERLLELSRQQQQQPQPQPVNLSIRLRSALASKEILFTQGGLTPVTAIEDDAVVQASPESADCIFDNLLSNALKYSAGGEITVTLARQEAGVLFAVENAVDSTALPDPQQVWDPFYVGERSRNKALSGTGLGLSMVQAVAEQYGCTTGCTVENGRFRIWVLFTL